MLDKEATPTDNLLRWRNLPSPSELTDFVDGFRECNRCLKGFSVRVDMVGGHGRFFLEMPVQGEQQKRLSVARSCLSLL
ncbi:MAG: hypothetical protein N3B10_13180 [Armatimonadetes bacterium]|nr:hypothetical protein [Armatimonadota bacterium]MCX7969420.1 hypothetical protein [Armatimonadota bacterium]MDW8144245.1 hypothetical protein [Armatimonadota bacterium]